MKSILITGSSSGIGKAIASNLIAKDYQVIGLARNHAKFSPSSKLYLPYVVDFSNLKILENQLKLIQQKHHVDSIICSAGYGEFKSIEQFSSQQMIDLMNVNFLSQAILIKTFLGNLKKNKSGKIVILGSEAAINGEKNGSMYCASKFALRGFTQSLRKECKQSNIAVTLINPGFVTTPFFNQLNFTPGDKTENSIEPHQIAKLVMSLLEMENNCVVEEIQLQPLKKVIKKSKNIKF